MRHMLASMAYRTIRHTAIAGFNISQRVAGKPVDLEPVIHWGDKVMAQVPEWVLNGLTTDVPTRCRTAFLGLSFRSPLIASSFKDDPAMLLFWYRLGLGSVIYKTVLSQPRTGNVQPRIQDLGAQGLINAMGLPGMGVAALATQIATKQNPVFQLAAPIGISVGGENPAEYREVFDRLHDAIVRDDVFFEVNISCPNTDEGQSLLAHPELLEALLQYMRQKTDRVIGVKLSPDQSDERLSVFAEVLRAVPRVYVNVGNTQYRTCGAVSLDAQALSRGGGGLSGPLLFPRTLEMVRLMASFGLPIMATGGISTPAQVAAVREAGAGLIGMATALVKDPFVVPRLLSDM